MDNREEVREFLISRRARITPAGAGLPGGSKRRVPGPRGSEAAEPGSPSEEGRRLLASRGATQEAEAAGNAEARS